MLMLGVGLVQSLGRPLERGEMYPLTTRSDWQIERSSARIVMETRQEMGRWSLELTRQLQLLNRTLVSETRLANVGQDPIRFRWYPHPFFPNPRGESCKFNITVALPENPDYELLDNGFIQIRDARHWTRLGHFLALEPSAEQPLVVLQRHPKLGLVAATCTYAPTYFPIWGNCNSFSFEPYLEQSVAPGAESDWSITYDF